MAANSWSARSRRRRRSRRGGYGLFLLPGLILTLAVIILPLVMNIGISFTSWQGIGDPTWVGLDNYSKLIKDDVFWTSFEHNIIMLVAMAIVPTMVGLVIAYALFDYISRRFTPKVAAVIRACVYLPQILPVAVVGVVWSWILAPENGALNQFFDAIGLGGLRQDWLGDPKLALYSVAVMMIWVQVGYPVVIFMAGLGRVAPELYEAAELDGASWIRKFWNITVPQIKPEISVVLLTSAIAALKVFAPIFVLTRGGPGGSTNVPSYFSYVEFFEKTQVGYGAAISTVLTVVILVLTAAFLWAQGRGEEA